MMVEIEILKWGLLTGAIICFSINLIGLYYFIRFLIRGHF